MLACVAPLSCATDAPSYQALLRDAQTRSPQLLEQGANVRAAQADARQAAAWLNPSVSVTAENLGAPKQDGVSQRQDTLTFSQSFETGGKRAARIGAEQGKSDVIAARARQKAVAFSCELAVAYAVAEAMQLRLEVARLDASRAADDLRAAEALVQAGREAPLRLAQANTGIAAAEAAFSAAQADLVEALEHLSALAGVSEPFTRITRPLLTSIAAPQATPGWTAANAPALASAVAEREAASAQLRLEEKRSMPDIAVSLGMRKFGWSDGKAATVAVSANIPLFDRNHAGIDAARERAAAASLRVEAAQLDAAASQRAAVARTLAADQRLLSAAKGEAAAEEAYKLGRIGYQAGKTALIELLAIRRALAEAKLLIIEAQLARVRAVASLSMAEGRILF